MFEFWLALRLFREKKSRLINPVTALALLGMILSVGTLTLTMAVISGFQSTIQKSVVDVMGDLVLFKRGEPIDNLEILMPKLKKIAPEIIAATPYVQVDGMAAHHGRISGVVVQGLDESTVASTLNLRSRIVEGQYNLSDDGALPNIVVGRGLKDKLGIKIGDELAVVLPKSSPTAARTGFIPQKKQFRVAGVIDLGMYEYDSRFILASAASAQKLAGFGPFYQGLRVRIKDSMKAGETNILLASELGSNYFVRDWMESHHNLLEAIRLEKVVIFVIMLFMTVAACFNIASTLFISVFRRYPDIALLKTMGATRGRILRFFSLQGMILGFAGSVLGLLLGFILCLIVAKTNLIYVPAEVYHFSHLPVDVRPLDVLMVLVATLILCFVSTLAPAWRGGRLNPVDGLKYES